MKKKKQRGFMVRLPEEYKEVLTEIKSKNRRTITAEVQIAIDMYLKREGYAPVKST